MRNPIRRSRKIGKTQGGRVKDGRAREKRSRVVPQDVWTRLSAQEGKWHVVRETPAGGTFHPATGDEYLAVLERLPARLTSSLKAIVLRRTPERDRRAGVEASLRNRCAVMYSFPSSMVEWFAKRPARITVRHFAPWCGNWDTDGQAWWITWSPEELRRYYLYHLFLHELGHLNEPKGYDRRRSEHFAEAFALDWARKLGELTLDYDGAVRRLVEELDARDRERAAESGPERAGDG